MSSRRCFVLSSWFLGIGKPALLLRVQTKCSETRPLCVRVDNSGRFMSVDAIRFSLCGVPEVGAGRRLVIRGRLSKTTRARSSFRVEERS